LQAAIDPTFTVDLNTPPREGRTMSKTRAPVVAGLFYPAEPDRLRQEVHHYLTAAKPGDVAPPKAVIAPHAGYVYSGPVAASVYARIAPLRGTVTRVVVLGPSHRVGFHGIATSSAEFFHTPLGDIPVDLPAVQGLSRLPQVRTFDLAHAQEHSVEVHLPFLQEILGTFRLVPLVVGEAGAEEVAEVLELLWGGPETFIVISSDLSHYHDYHTARERDAATSRAIEALRPEAIHEEDACGRNAVSGLLEVARRHGYSIEAVDLRNSGDTAGPRDRVVGYGAYVLH
jgi:hypothetical protein